MMAKIDITEDIRKDTHFFWAIITLITKYDEDHPGHSPGATWEEKWGITRDEFVKGKTSLEVECKIGGKDVDLKHVIERLVADIDLRVEKAALDKFTEAYHDKMYELEQSFDQIRHKLEKQFEIKRGE
jgi:hypothetical protein